MYGLVLQLTHFWWSGSAGFLLGCLSVFTGLGFLDVTSESDRINTADSWSSGVSARRWEDMCALVFDFACTKPL